MFTHAGWLDVFVFTTNKIPNALEQSLRSHAKADLECVGFTKLQYFPAITQYSLVLIFHNPDQT
jgi:hypothetical protein